MARLRKFSAYQKVERPYTRASKFKKKNFVRAVPNRNVVRYDMGNPKGTFDTTLRLIANKDIQIRHNALESARMTSNRYLEANLGKPAYHLKIKVFPFHILRENPLAAGAGADRMSTGMKKSFGKPIGTAAQTSVDQTIFEVRVNKKNIKAGKLALKRASYKLPCSCRIIEAA
ncbi:50S ribosomal protein L16 [Nanoarchaeota archaeon]